MGAILLKWLVLTVVLLAAAAAMPKVKVRSWGAAFCATAVFAILNMTVGWLLSRILTVVLILPIILTFGLAYLVVPLAVNMVLLKVVDGLSEEEVDIEGVPALVALAAILAVTNAILHW